MGIKEKKNRVKESGSARIETNCSIKQDGHSRPQQKVGDS